MPFILIKIDVAIYSSPTFRSLKTSQVCCCQFGVVRSLCYNHMIQDGNTTEEVWYSANIML